MCMKSHINVIGMLWMGGEGCTTYNISQKEIENMKPITRNGMLKYIKGKDFESIVDAEGLFLIGHEFDEKDDIFSCQCNFFRIPWEHEENEFKFNKATFGD